MPRVNKPLDDYTPEEWLDKDTKTELRKKTIRARRKVLTEVRRKGFITNERAKEVGGWAQAWYHLNQLVEDGFLKRDEYNRWTLVKSGTQWYQQARKRLSQQLEA